MSATKPRLPSRSMSVENPSPQPPAYRASAHLQGKGISECQERRTERRCETQGPVRPSPALSGKFLGPSTRRVKNADGGNGSTRRGGARPPPPPPPSQT